MHMVICQFRNTDGNVIYLLANNRATDARIDEVNSEERITLHYGDYADMLSRFRSMADEAGGLREAELGRLEDFHHIAGYVEEAPEPEPTREEPNVDTDQVDTRAPRGASPNYAERIRRLASWAIHGQRD